MLLPARREDEDAGGQASPSARHTSSPCMPGRLRSRTRTSGRVARARRTVDGPSAAVADDPEARPGEVALEAPTATAGGRRRRATVGSAAARRRLEVLGSSMRVLRAAGDGHPHDAAAPGPRRPGHGATAGPRRAPDRATDTHPAVGRRPRAGRAARRRRRCRGSSPRCRPESPSRSTQARAPGPACRRDVVEGGGDRVVDLVGDRRVDEDRVGRHRHRRRRPLAGREQQPQVGSAPGTRAGRRRRRAIGRTGAGDEAAQRALLLGGEAPTARPPARRSRRRGGG